SWRRTEDQCIENRHGLEILRGRLLHNQHVKPAFFQGRYALRCSAAKPHGRVATRSDREEVPVGGRQGSSPGPPAARRRQDAPGLEERSRGIRLLSTVRRDGGI